MPSEVIRGYQMPSEVIRGYRRSSEVIRGYQMPSEVIRGYQMSSSERWRGHAFERGRRTVALSSEAGDARGHARCNLARQIARRVLVLWRKRPPSRTHGQDSSGSAPMGSSGVIRSHQESSVVIRSHLGSSPICTLRGKGGGHHTLPQKSATVRLIRVSSTILRSPNSYFSFPVIFHT